MVNWANVSSSLAQLGAAQLRRQKCKFNMLNFNGKNHVPNWTFSLNFYRGKISLTKNII